GAYFTNTTYAALSMRDGDSFSKKFGGELGSDPDWFLLKISGLNAGGGVTGTVDFYLADYRFADNRQDFIVDTWTWVDLSSLGEVSSLKFDLSSSDTGDWGMNTPAFFAMDDLVSAPEPSTLALSCAGIAAAAAAWIVRRRRRAREEAA
ncbi:MAG: DUF4465 domain-containing protein, partial [Planctomycetes bacterium]|nr:DUF4465 domain-containing protein [Planctomycetota bacterium]